MAQKRENVLKKYKQNKNKKMIDKWKILKLKGNLQQMEQFRFSTFIISSVFREFFEKKIRY